VLLTVCAAGVSYSVIETAQLRWVRAKTVGVQPSNPDDRWTVTRLFRRLFARRFSATGLPKEDVPETAIGSTVEWSLRRPFLRRPTRLRRPVFAGDFADGGVDALDAGAAGVEASVHGRR